MKMLSLDDAIKAVTMLLDYETDTDKIWSCDVINNLQNAPSVTDAEPVVRCKQCRQWDDSSEGRYVGGWCFCDRMQMSTSPEFYCADGEAEHEQIDRR